MYDRDTETMVYIFLLVALIAASIFGAALIEKAQCTAKTENIGFNSHWSVFGGCQIEVTDGQWIPLESYYFKQE